MWLDVEDFLLFEMATPSTAPLEPHRWLTRDFTSGEDIFEEQISEANEYMNNDSSGHRPKLADRSE